MLVKPKKLRKGDIIGVVAPGSPVSSLKLKRGIQYIQKEGYQVKIGKNVLKENYYLAGDDSERAEDFNDMFYDIDVKAIFFARGGYGSIRLLEMIDYKYIQSHPKILAGYSDATAIQLALLKKSHLVTFSAPMVAADFASKTVSIHAENHFWAILKKQRHAKELSRFNTSVIETLYPGKAQGALICGCLSVLLGLIGTQFCPDFNGAILVLEDIGEEPYKIDRAITTLKLHGVFKKISGLVLGQFVNCQALKKRDKEITIKDIILPIVTEYSLPAMMNLSYGHIPDKITLPLGVQAEIDTWKNKFVLLDDAVE